MTLFKGTCILFIFQLYFEAVIGLGISNDMALDDITLTDTACQSKFPCLNCV